MQLSLPPAPTTCPFTAQYIKSHFPAPTNYYIMNSPEATTSNEKERNIDIAKKAFEGVITTPSIESRINVRRYKRALRFAVEDLLFSLTFHESEEGNLVLLDCLQSIYETIKELVQRLKDFFDDKQRRLCFFTATVDNIVSPVLSGGQDLHKETVESIAMAILKPLFVYLCSNSELDLSKGLEIKCSVMSLAHTAAYDKKKGRKPHAIRKPPPEDVVAGHRGASLKDISHYSGPNHGLIVVPRGTPAEPDLFHNKCLPAQA